MEGDGWCGAVILSMMSSQKGEHSVGDGEEHVGAGHWHAGFLRVEKFISDEQYCFCALR